MPGRPSVGPGSLSPMNSPKKRSSEALGPRMSIATADSKSPLGDKRKNLENIMPENAVQQKSAKKKKTAQSDPALSSAASISRPVMLNMDDVLQFSRALEQKDEKIESLKGKKELLKKQKLQVDQENQVLSQRLETLSHTNDLLLAQLAEARAALRTQSDEHERRSQDLAAECSALRTKYDVVSRNFPANLMHTLTVYLKMMRDSDEKLTLKSTVEEKAALIRQLERDLKAAQENIGSLYTKKGELEVKLERVKQEEQMRIGELEKINASLLLELGDKSTIYREMSAQVAQLKEKFFFSYVIALKMSIVAYGGTCNINAQALFEEVQRDAVPFADWDKWLAAKAAKATG
eukprot:TRINITY_DN10097_c0_g1_i1.p1 TRINITY_DN10097_c0_g1~~TRINITY_DN10097_c0_g1_i1.p1  ORF type:complete len:391 (+),score=102.93 TRINITY_DN10097_c0_g1_i1:128-1174(+)